MMYRFIYIPGTGPTFPPPDYIKTPLFIQLTGDMAVLIAELGIDCLAPLVKGFTDVSSQLEGFVYTNLQLSSVAITPLLIV